MIERIGNMWDVFEEADLWLFTGNSYITRDGRLVMGKGIAKQVLDKFPGVDGYFGGIIPHLGKYGVERCMIPNVYPYQLGVFQVKTNFKYAATPDLIRLSCQVLVGAHIRHHPNMVVHMNYPGIGNGRLSIETVRPIISILPDNVHVWRYE